jgi:6-pyruvoyltetrahydropterin/6-carboxytetrahydropterin synthase
MYTLAVRRTFVAQHFLIGGEWGSENFWHSHYYQLELQLEGERLNQHGYLVDIVQVEAALNELVAAYRDKTLNDLPQFAGLNPSIEHFTRIAAQELAPKVYAENLSALVVKIWENEIAWASHRLVLPLV